MGQRLGTGRTIILCRLISALGVIIMVLAEPGFAPAGTVAVVAGGQGLYGVAMGMSNSHEMSYRQLVTPDEMQARTNTTPHSLNRAIIMVIAPLAGILADAWGNRPTLVIAAVIFALVASGLRASSVREVRASA